MIGPFVSVDRNEVATKTVFLASGDLRNRRFSRNKLEPMLDFCQFYDSQVMYIHGTNLSLLPKDMKHPGYFSGDVNA